MNIAYTALAVIIAAGVAGAYGYMRGEESGRLQVQSKWDAERAELEAIHARDQQIAREREKLMQQTADRLRQEKDRETRDLNSRVTALTNSLRERPSRTADSISAMSSTTNAGCAPVVCTGAGLSKEDGEFLAREAARGAEAVALLKQCQAQYQSLIPK
jgi:Flp pilus assembly protein TadB